MKRDLLITDVINHLADHHKVFDEAVKIKCIQEGDPEFIFIIGENASGKSYLSKLTCAYFDQVLKERVFNWGMGHRTTSEGFEKIAVYGDQYEVQESTGNITVASLLRVLKQSSEYCEDKHVVVLDEPECGLAERFTIPLAALISENINDKPALRRGFAVVSHNRKLLAEIERVSDKKPTVFVLGEFNKGYKQWIEQGDDTASLDELLNLKKKASETNRNIGRVKFKFRDMPELK